MTDVYSDPEYLALVAGICADPDADVPRLVTADWLQEHGEGQWAEFIWVQCELARTPQYDAICCKVCGATADEDGCVEHGRGCYVLDSDGGGSESAPVNEDWERLRLRELELINFTWQNWLGACRKIIPLGMRIPEYVQFRRGFVERVTCPAVDWLAHADAILAHQPVRLVELTTMPSLDNIGRPYCGWLEYSREKWPGIVFQLPP